MSDAIEDPRLAAYDPPVPAGLRRASSEDAIFHAWDLLKLVLARFWSPVALAALPFIWQPEKLKLLDWLRPVELMLRRMIFLEASALAPTLAEPSLRTARQPSSLQESDTRQPSAFDAGHPDTWRTPFAPLSLAHAKHARHQRRPRRYDPVDPRERQCKHATKPLALRLEAAIRVVTNPMPWIRRLAARMRRCGIPTMDQLAATPLIRIPSALRTLNRLACDMGLQAQPYPDDS